MMDVEALGGIDHGQHQLLPVSPASAAGAYDHRFDIGNGEFQCVLDAQRSGGDDVAIDPNHKHMDVGVAQCGFQ